MGRDLEGSRPLLDLRPQEKNEADQDASDPEAVVNEDGQDDANDDQ